jgi:hypothetical protein
MKFFKFFSRIFLLLIFAGSLIFISFKPEELIEFKEVFQTEISTRNAEAKAKSEDLAAIKKASVPKGVNQDRAKTIMTIVNLVLIFLIFKKREFFVKLIQFDRKMINMSPPDKRKFVACITLAPIIVSLILSLINLSAHWSDLFSYAEWFEGYPGLGSRSIRMKVWSTGWVYLLCELSQICSHYLFLRLVYDVSKESKVLEQRKTVES